MKSRVFAAGMLVALLAPTLALAAPFGGRSGLVVPCFNGVIFAEVGAPSGGSFIWMPGATQTYRFGPPARSGQWLLGLTGVPYFCLMSIVPIIVIPGITMSMLGSSQ